ncbi:MAG: DUF1800 domain-containing protein [Chloroflexi bacterium]|nr:DUF1800 domain-containing protein [Chloroflexota bacterium]
MPSERDLVAHLLRRAGFGAFPDAYEYFAGQGFTATFDWLLDGQRPDDPAIAELQYDLGTIAGVKRWWLHRLLLTRQPLREKMVLFWHGHFATANRKVGNPGWMAQQLELFRAHALGDFRALVRSVTYDPAMMRWLDLHGSHRRVPNENYARELMELFAIGRGNYTEQDIKEVARALTGWRLDQGKLVFDPGRHDDGIKTVLGERGNWKADEVVDIVTRQPACARFIARKLLAFFVYDDPEPGVVERFAAIFASSAYSVRALVEAILRSPEFRSDRAYHAKIKSPVDFVVGALKDLDVRTVPAGLNVAASTAAMGQDVLDPPSVKGWDGGSTWLSAGWFIARCNFVAALLSGRHPDGRPWVDTMRLAAGFDGGWDTYGIVERLAQRTLGADGGAKALDLVAQAAGDLTDVANRGRRDQRVRAILHLLLTSPAYQFL